MQPKSPSILECPVGRAVETVGEWWSILILRDALQGATRFDEFSRNLGIAPNILSRRLAHLTETGMFVRRRYNERPPRYEYVLTAKARDFFPVIATMLAWGNKHLAPEGKSVIVVDSETGDARGQRLRPFGQRTEPALAGEQPAPGQFDTAGER